MNITTKNQLDEYLSNKSAPYDVYQIAKDIEVEVTSDLDWDKLGYDGEIYLNNDNNPEIWINPTSNINRQRFTLAHELGHLFNDVIPNIDKFKDPILDDYTTLKRNGAIDIKEFKANLFAAELLMPIKDINKIGLEAVSAYQKKYGSEKKVPKDEFVKKMAKIFQVSENSMKYRLQEIFA